MVLENIVTYSFQEFMYELSKNDTRYLTAKEELNEYNIIKEYKGIHMFYNMRCKMFKDKYEEARYNILKWIITCATHDPENGDYSDAKNNE